METAEETKKCPVCAETIKFEAIKCRFCGEDLKKGISPDVSGVTLYFKYGDGFNWVKSGSKQDAEKHVKRKFGLKHVNWISLDELIQGMAVQGWAVSFKSDDIITFRRLKSSFSVFTCLILLLFFVLPAIIYAIVTASPKEQLMTFPLR